MEALFSSFVGSNMIGPSTFLGSGSIQIGDTLGEDLGNFGGRIGDQTFSISRDEELYSAQEDNNEGLKNNGSSLSNLTNSFTLHHEVGGGFDMRGFEALLNLHNDLQKFHNLTVQAQCADNEASSYDFANKYKKLHGYLALFVCVFGAIANILIMVVLTRKEMRTPINLMLLALAIADLLIMIEYIPFALHMYIIDPGPEKKYSLGWAWFVFFHLHFTQILHTISIQLTLTMAIWRYAAIKSTTQSSTFCTFKRCYQAITAAYICPVFFCILNYLYFQIVRKTKFVTYGPPPFNVIDEGDSEKLQIYTKACSYLGLHNCGNRKVDLYIVEMSELARNHPILHTMHFWTFSVLIKLIPCFVLTFFMCWLVNTLYKARRHHKMLEASSAPLRAVATPTCETRAFSPSNEPTPLRLNPSSKNTTFTNGRALPSQSQSESDDNLPPDLDEISPKTGLLNVQHSNGTKPDHDSNSPESSPASGRNNGQGRQRPVTLIEVNEEGTSSNTAIRIGRRFTQGLITFTSFRRPSPAPDGSGSSRGRGKSSCKRTDRTSKMLIAVLFLFLLTEFPQGIMSFLTGWYGPEFLRCNYNSWAEIWDMLALINSAVNFILYCFMSKQFRTQFRLSFKLDKCFKGSKWIRIGACNTNATVTTTV